MLFFAGKATAWRWPNPKGATFGGGYARIDFPSLVAHPYIRSLQQGTTGFVVDQGTTCWFLRA